MVSSPAGRRSRSGVAMAFGPGLVIEMARLTYVPSVDLALPCAVAAPPVRLAPTTNDRSVGYGA